MKVNTPLLTAEQLDAGHIEQHTDNVTIRVGSLETVMGRYLVIRSATHRKGARNFTVMGLDRAREVALKLEKGEEP
jgi:hypothetical protein